MEKPPRRRKFGRQPELFDPRTISVYLEARDILLVEIWGARQQPPLERSAVIRLAIALMCTDISDEEIEAARQAKKKKS